MKSLLIHITAKIVLVCVFIMFLSIFSTAFYPTLNNQFAMGQLESDDFAFATWEMWQGAYVAIEIAMNAAIGITGIWIAFDVYKYFKTRKEN